MMGLFVLTGRSDVVDIAPKKRKAVKKSPEAGSSPPAEILSPAATAPPVICARLSDIPGLGPVALDSMLAFARDDRNVQLVEGLLSHINGAQTSSRKGKAGTQTAKKKSASEIETISDTTADASGETETTTTTTTAANKVEPASLPLVGRSVVFTGTLSSMSRKEAQELCERLGKTLSP